jgi:hypothetical protein
MTLESVPALPPPALPGAEERPDSAPAAVAAPVLNPAAQPGALDALFVVVVSALAFLLASTPARNSDLWLHLASGRALVRGQSPLGTDPFASTTAGIFWANHAWLGDALLYALYEIGDGVLLVVAKAVLLAGLAALFFCFRRRGARAGMLAVAAACAVLALGPWLSLQPALLSLPGVTLTLYLLERPSLLDGPRAERARLWRWLLVPLFALWANLDGWFLLGPVLVALYALGESLRRLAGGAGSVRPGELRAMTLLALAGLAACFLTPYPSHTFAWPTPLGLSHAEQVLMSDPAGQGLVASPFVPHSALPFAFAGPGGWAYCLLLAAGAASFILCRGALHPGRLLVWLALAALSVYQARAIPFFAVAAGPILALNLQERFRAMTLTEQTRRFQTAVRIAGALAGLALLVLAWPGWFQPAPYQPRRWAVEPDESMVRLARQIEKGHKEQRFRPDRFALTFSPEAANYLAWFCPSELGFLDSRWPLFDGAAEDFVRMRRCLLPPNGQDPDPQLGSLLDAHRIDRIVLYDPDYGRTVRAFRCLLLDGEEWELLNLEGDAALFGRRSAGDASSPWKPLDLKQAAYHPEPDHRAPLTAPRAPQPPGLFDSFWRARDDRSADRAEAALYLVYFDLMAERERPDLGAQQLLALATGLVGSAPGGEPAGASAALALRLHLTPLSTQNAGGTGQQAAEAFAAGFLASHDRGPLEALLLAVRAARRALAANPDDPGAYLLLGEAYVRLASQTRERSWRATLPPLAALRHAQALAALEQAALLRPDLDRAHALLVQLYYDDGQLDRALEHLRARARIAGPEGAEMRADADTMESLVKRSEKVYEANVADKTDPSKVFRRASLAARHGLSRKALEMLLESHPAVFGDAGVRLQLDLMMQAGRAFEVRAWLEPQHEAVLGFTPYHSLRAEADAACGDYAGADAELDVLGEKVRQVGISPKQLAPVRAAVALRVGSATLARPDFAAGPAGLAGTGFAQFDALRPLAGPADLLRQEADIRVFRGLLALESGAVEDAGQHFRAALEVWGGDGPAATGAGLDFPTRPIAQYGLRLLER